MRYHACFIAYMRRHAYSLATIKSYDYALSDYISYFRLGRKRAPLLQGFNPRQLESYKKYLLKTRGLRPSTANRRLTALSAFARLLIERGLLPYNPLELVARVKSDGSDKTRPIASRQEVQDLCREVGRDVLELPGRLIVELLYTGISVRELRGLRYDKQASLEIIKVGGRVITLHPEAQLALNHYLILRPVLRGDYLIAGEAADGSLKPGAIYYIMRKFSQKINARVAVRDLRLARFAQAPDVKASVENAA